MKKYLDKEKQLKFESFRDVENENFSAKLKSYISENKLTVKYLEEPYSFNTYGFINEIGLYFSISCPLTDSLIDILKDYYEK
jgi:hypothetical protein